MEGSQIIVDAHTHIYPRVQGLIAGGPTRGLGYGLAAIGNNEIRAAPPFGEETRSTPELLLANMDWAGIDKAVLLQGPFYGECNQYVLEAANRYSDRLIAAAYLDPWDQHSRSALDNIVSMSGFRAIKLECSESFGLCGIHPQAKLDAPEIAWAWRKLEGHGLVLVLDLGSIGSRSYQTEAVRKIAQKHPDLRIVIPHLAQPTPTVENDPDLWRLWLDQIDLGRLPNIWFDNASLITYLPDEDYPYPSAERYMRLAIERIGAEKVMWGTDQPGNFIYATYPQFVKLARLHTQFLSSDEQTLVLGGNALQVYG